MSNFILWQAFSTFPILCSLTCDSTSVTSDWFRWGRRLGGGKKEGCKERTKALFIPPPCNSYSSVWLWTRDEMVSWRKRLRQNSCGSDCIATESNTVLLQWQCSGLSSAGSLGFMWPRGAQGREFSPLLVGKFWHGSALKTRRVHRAHAWAFQTMPSSRVPVTVQRERRESPTPVSPPPPTGK